MQIYVKSAGFSVNQDYCWVDSSGDRADVNMSVLNYNVDSVKFVWKSTDTAIYIFGNAFVDKSRVDLYNRPLRNYILLEGRVQEAAYMCCCLEKMLLDQQYFTNMLNSSICNVSGDSETGFTVDFQKISAYFESQTYSSKEACRLKRHRYEKDSCEARKELLKELWGEQGSPVTLLIGGELSGQRLKELSPDRALLDHVGNADVGNHRDSGTGETHKSVKALAVTLGVCALASSILVLTTRKRT